MAVNSSDLAAMVTIRSLEPDVEPNEANMRLALAALSRDDALFFCARINAIITGFGLEANHLQRQRLAIQMLCSPAQIRRLEKFAARHGGGGRVKVFFRGQLLELARWLALFGVNDPADGDTFASPRNRAKFARAAFIASELWERRLFGIKGIQPSLDPYAQLRTLLGPFRKNLEDANLAPHPGFTIFRAWKLFSTYVQRHLPDFDAVFQKSTGLTVHEYFVCAFAILPRTFFNHPDGQRMFKSAYVEGNSPFATTFATFMGLHSQTPDEWASRLRKAPVEPADISLRQRPILNFSGGRSIILDPWLFLDNLTSAPLFFAIQGGLDANRVFGGFGQAVEEYVVDLFRRLYPAATSDSDERLHCNVEGANLARQEFEIDVLVADRASMAVVEVKAAWIRDDKVLHVDSEEFIREVRKKYGYVPDTADRGKGVAQLARIVGALARREWPTSEADFGKVGDEVYSVLLVYDRRMASPGIAHFLDTEFRQLLGPVPESAGISPIIVMTVGDLEFVVSTLGPGGFLRLLREYSAADPERMSSFHNFVLRVHPKDPQAQNPMLVELNDELMAAARSILIWTQESPIAEGLDVTITKQ